MSPSFQHALIRSGAGTPDPRVEAASWRKSSFSSSSGACVEAGHAPGIVGVRDSKLGDSSPVLEFPAADWRRFTAALKTPLNFSA